MIKYLFLGFVIGCDIALFTAIICEFILNKKGKIKSYEKKYKRVYGRRAR